MLPLNIATSHLYTRLFILRGLAVKQVCCLNMGLQHSLTFQSQQEPWNEIDDWCDWHENYLILTLVQCGWDSLSFVTFLLLYYCSWSPAVIIYHHLPPGWFSIKISCGSPQTCKTQLCFIVPSTCNFPIHASWVCCQSHHET